MRVLFHTFGCKVNQYDSESLANLLRERGHEVVQDLAAADVVVVNTCTVTKEGSARRANGSGRLPRNTGIRNLL